MQRLERLMHYSDVRVGDSFPTKEGNWPILAQVCDVGSNCFYYYWKDANKEEQSRAVTGSQLEEVVLIRAIGLDLIILAGTKSYITLLNL